MFAQLPEQRMHWIRWILTIGWLLVVASLFYDPWTAAFTEPDHPWSPLRLSDQGVQVQGVSPHSSFIVMMTRLCRLVLLRSPLQNW